MIEQFQGQTIQHGKFNDRIYLMKLNPDGAENVPEKLIGMAQSMKYSKIFAKSGQRQLPVFIDQEFTVEAVIPGYFKGQEDLFMVCYYLREDRGIETRAKEYERVLNVAKSKAHEPPRQKNERSAFTIRACDAGDIPQMADIYRQVFPSYPFPIHDPDYLQKTMTGNVDYYCVESHGDILALSSAEVDHTAKSAEMTDFATLPENRKKRLAGRLLSVMETETAKKGIKTFYTIARAISYGMNITFARDGYMFGGRLKNNTNISGDIESMNIWYKRVNGHNA
ncbi:MAG: putative beta-lysine N-acetyltransferase [Lentisphaeria bacterium]|nr:putative beta-lysine N-acetyltransferase [Lentisphaeria bacterium]